MKTVLNKLTNWKIGLGIIILLAAFLRFYQLGQNPPSLTWDEAAWGYNAYAIGIDGRDEFGRFLPLDYLESFGDFKPPVYAYLAIIPIKLFGLNEFAVRFPSAFFGFLTVIVFYFLIKQITGDKILSTIAPFLFVLGGLLLCKAFNKNKIGTFLVGTVCFIAGLYSYNLTRLLSPALYA